MSQTRRLAAILAADVAGYSRLMGADEEGTLAALKAIRRELSDPKVKEHHGRIVKTTGDGLLIEFASVVDAVRCAVEVQRAMAERNTDVPPDRRIELRMGIWATSSRTGATSTATGSMSQHGSKPWPNPAEFASAAFLEKNRKFVDSPLEKDGFENSVSRQIGSGFKASVGLGPIDVGAAGSSGRSSGSATDRAVSAAQGAAPPK